MISCTLVIGAIAPWAAFWLNGLKLLKEPIAPAACFMFMANVCDCVTACEIDVPICCALMAACANALWMAPADVTESAEIFRFMLPKLDIWESAVAICWSFVTAASGTLPSAVTTFEIAVAAGPSPMPLPTAAFTLRSAVASRFNACSAALEFAVIFSWSVVSATQVTPSGLLKERLNLDASSFR